MADSALDEIGSLVRQVPNRFTTNMSTSRVAGLWFVSEKQYWLENCTS